jgi:hypothetical protein
MATESESSPEVALAISSKGEVALFRQATNVASLCREIVLATTTVIGTKKYVQVEGWTAIAVAHGCIASIKDDSVKEVFRDGKLVGTRAIAELRRQADGAILSSAEGFVGVDEPDWYGSGGLPIKKWSKRAGKEVDVVVEKRADYAIRAMAQTRSLSRVCRSAFSHVVVLMKEGLSTVPAEEVVSGGVDADLDAGTPPAGAAPEQAATTSKPAEKPAAASSAKTETKAPEVPRDEIVALRDQFRGNKWETVKFHFGKNKGTQLGSLEPSNLKWWIDNYAVKPYGNPPTVGQDDLCLRAALDVASEEAFN